MSTDLIDFLNIREKCLQFLNDEDNRYKYRTYYIDNINDSIETEIENQLVMFILLIKKEAGTCRTHNTCDALKKQSKTEVEIISESLKILTKYKLNKIAEINTILNYEKNIFYENTIGYSGIQIINVWFDPITDINTNNLYYILQNLWDISSLREINNCKINDKLNSIIRYLKCFETFKYYSLD
jgi:hypothetical protein